MIQKNKRITKADILALDLNDISKLKKSELKAYIQSGTDIITKRNKRIAEKTGDRGVLVRFNEEKYSIENIKYNKEDSINLLRHKLKNIKDNLKSVGTTVSGQEKILKDFSKRIAEQRIMQGDKKSLSELTKDIRKSLTEDNIREFWGIYNNLAPQTINRNYSSSQLQKDIYELYIDKDLSRINVGELIKKASDKNYIMRELEESEEDDGGLDI